MKEYSELDDCLLTKSPPTEHEGEQETAREETLYSYDHEHNLTSRTAPTGRATQQNDDYITNWTTDRLGRVTDEKRIATDDGPPQTNDDGVERFNENPGILGTGQQSVGVNTTSEASSEGYGRVRPVKPIEPQCALCPHEDTYAAVERANSSDDVGDLLSDAWNAWRSNHDPYDDPKLTWGSAAEGTADQLSVVGGPRPKPQ